jgi:hypothetical protein
MRAFSLPLLVLFLLSVHLGVFVFALGEYKSPTRPQTDADEVAEPKTVSACEGRRLTMRRRSVAGMNVNIRQGPSTDFQRVTWGARPDLPGGTQLAQLEEGMVVFEECVQGEWAWVRVTRPPQLADTHQGWVATEFLQ